MKLAKMCLAVILVLSLGLQSGVPIMAAQEEKGIVPWVDKSPIWFSRGHDWFEEPLWADGDAFEQFTWEGPTSPDSNGWLDVTAEGVNGQIKHGRPTFFSVRYDTIVGGDYPRFGDDVIFKCKVRYKPDGTPEYVDPDTGLPFDGLFLRMGVWVALREIRQWRTCAWFIAASIYMGVPGAACWNPIWFKSDDSPAEFQSFDEQLINLNNLLESLDASKSAASRRYCIPLIFNSHDLVGLTVQVTYKVAGRKISTVRRINFDYDRDGRDNGTEIIDGTDPYDPNDPGEDNDTYVPCPPPGVKWTLSQVDAALQNNGLHRIGNPIYENSDTVDENYFLHYDKECEAIVPEGTGVKVYLSAGPLDNGDVALPCYAEDPYDSEVQQDLSDLGFDCESGRIVVYCPSDPRVGDVNKWLAAECWQNYLRYWECGDKEDPETFVPRYLVKGCIDPNDYCGRDWHVVKSELENLGFHVTSQEQANSTVDPGEVFSVTVNDCNVVICYAPLQTNPLSASFISPTNNSAFSSGNLVNFKMNIVGGTPPFTIRFLFETGPIPGWQESETSSRTPFWNINVNSTAEPGPTHATGYGRVTDSTGAQTEVFEVHYTVD